MNENTEKTFDMSKRVTIRNTTSIPTYFRYVDRDADAKVAGKSKLSLPVSEVLAQADNGNPDFVGYNRDGKHATFYIEDKETRIYLGFETEDGKTKQEIVDEQAVVNMFDAVNLQTFANLLVDKIVTGGEKQTLRDVLAAGKVNAHDKIEMANAFLRGETLNVPKNKGGRPKGS